jgi:hypothetical protein
MNRKHRQPTPPPGAGYRSAGPPILCDNELADPNAPLPPVLPYVVPRLDDRTLELIRQWEAEAEDPSAPSPPNHPTT